MNNVKPDCWKVVDFYFLSPSPHKPIFRKSYTPENRLLLFYDFYAYCYYGLAGWGYWVCKMKVLHGLNYADYSSLLLRQRPNYCCLGGGGGWRSRQLWAPREGANCM